MTEKEKYWRDGVILITAGSVYREYYKIDGDRAIRVNVGKDYLEKDEFDDDLKYVGSRWMAKECWNIVGVYVDCIKTDLTDDENMSRYWKQGNVLVVENGWMFEVTDDVRAIGLGMHDGTFIEKETYYDNFVLNLRKHSTWNIVGVYEKKLTI